MVKEALAALPEKAIPMLAERGTTIKSPGKRGGVGHHTSTLTYNRKQASAT